ncbi:hypothetical protein [Streptomyces lateritius]|uniref:hypothetical protein n=1 Tax=Streptomyces lateritius TaxID=67313 RepID=UPI001C8B6B66|nr:hypothetical protein [Streptomyces lateritius]MBX9423681.1 hypothetical protein [Streptomyces lateritius]
MRTPLGRKRLAIAVGVALTAVTAASPTVPAASAAPASAVPAAVSRTAAPVLVPFLVPFASRVTTEAGTAPWNGTPYQQVS